MSHPARRYVSEVRDQQARRTRRAVVTAARDLVLDAAYARHPERFVRHAPVPPKLPIAVWINKPADTKETAAH